MEVVAQNVTAQNVTDQKVIAQKDEFFAARLAGFLRFHTNNGF